MSFAVRPCWYIAIICWLISFVNTFFAICQHFVIYQHLVIDFSSVMVYNKNKKRGETKLKDRLKKLRKTLDMTQQEFADKIGIARGNIGAYEVGKNALSDAVISLICKTDFPPKGKVNEKWLRTGEGGDDNMFIEAPRDEQISKFVGELLKEEEDSFKKRFISMLAALDESDWESLKKMVELLQEKRD